MGESERAGDATASFDGSHGGGAARESVSSHSYAMHIQQH